MPIMPCEQDGKPGFKWGDQGKCYPHDGTAAGKNRARKMAMRQALAIQAGGGLHMNESEILFVETAMEAVARDNKPPTGREWEVTIVGPTRPEDLLVSGGKEYLVSKNGRLYSLDAIRRQADLFEGVKVYDNHLTDKEFSERQGMRSPAREWLGTIVKTRWEEGIRSLRGIFKVVDDRLANKLLRGWEAGVLGTIGLSMDTHPIYGQALTVNGRQMPVVDGFHRVISVDLVGEAAAGGGFDRLIAAADIGRQESAVARTEVQMGDITEENVRGIVADALKELDLEAKIKTAMSSVLETDEADEAEAEAPEGGQETGPTGVGTQNGAPVTDPKLLREMEAMRVEMSKIATQKTLANLLATSGLPKHLQTVAQKAFPDGVIAGDEELKRVVESIQRSWRAQDRTGRPKDVGAAEITMGLTGDEVAEVEFLRLLAGNTAFRALENAKDHFVTERLPEAYQTWIKAGRPYYGTRRISEWAYQYLGGDPMANVRAYEAITTSDLASIVKNAMNVMLANSYSVRERWWDPIVRVEEVDTIDQATLVRSYGFDNLSVVSEGAAYTELGWEDEEETADFVKKGNYAGVTLEALLRDKVNEIRSIPTRLGNSWYNTLSALVSGVFTVNTAAGPALSDTGALFNATAVSSAGGHANLLTTALGYAAFDAAAVAMAKQTDQTLGTGRRLGIRPKYLLVPVDLENTALQIRNSIYQPHADFDAGTVGSGAQAINTYQGKFDVIPVPDWTDTDNWALVADPQMFPAIWLIFLRGRQVPELFSSEGENAGAMFTNDTLRYKVRMLTFRFSSTYDCAPVSDFRPLHKSNV